MLIQPFLQIQNTNDDDDHHHHHHHHHQLNVQFLPRLIKGMDGCFPIALGRQSTFSNICDSACDSEYTALAELL